MGLHLRDATGGFRLWRQQALVGMDVGRWVRSEGYVFQVEMASLASRLGYRIVEVPIEFPERVAGSSKMSFWIQAEAAWRVFEIRARHAWLSPKDRTLVVERKKPATQRAGADAGAVGVGTR